MAAIPTRNLPAILKHMTVAIMRHSGYSFEQAFNAARSKLEGWKFLKSGSKSGSIDKIRLAAGRAPKRESFHRNEGAAGTRKSKQFDELLQALLYQRARDAQGLMGVEIDAKFERAAQAAAKKGEKAQGRVERHAEREKAQTDKRRAKREASVSAAAQRSADRASAAAQRSSSRTTAVAQRSSGRVGPIDRPARRFAK
jgi:hypothetical protein